MSVMFGTCLRLTDTPDTRPVAATEGAGYGRMEVYG